VIADGNGNTVPMGALQTEGVFFEFPKPIFKDTLKVRCSSENMPLPNLCGPVRIGGELDRFWNRVSQTVLDRIALDIALEEAL